MEAIPSWILNISVLRGTSRTSTVHIRGATIYKSRNTVISTSVLAPSTLELTPSVLQTRSSCEIYLWQNLVARNLDVDICHSVAPEIAGVAMEADSASRFSRHGLGFQLTAVLDCEVTYHYRLDIINPVNLIYGGNRLVDDGEGTGHMGSELVIDRLRSTGIEEQNNVEGGTCAVCLDDLLLPKKELLRMPCSHVFHDQCIVPWLRRNNSCPICRNLIV